MIIRKRKNRQWHLGDGATLDAHAAVPKPGFLTHLTRCGEEFQASLTEVAGPEVKWHLLASTRRCHTCNAAYLEGAR